jgi:hypothetical protein
MKPIDEEKKGMKLESLKELIKEMKGGVLGKLPKGKGVTVMSVSVSKPKKDMEMKEEMPEDMSEMMEEKAEDLQEAPMMEMEESEENEESKEYEDEFKLPEPAIPEDLMELVKMMLKKKKED